MVEPFIKMIGLLIGQNQTHVEGKEPGPMLEILASIHLSLKKQSNGKSIYNLLHPYVKPGYQSFRRNPNLNASYENFCKEHWKKRA